MGFISSVSDIVTGMVHDTSSTLSDIDLLWLPDTATERARSLLSGLISIKFLYLCAPFFFMVKNLLAPINITGKQQTSYSLFFWRSQKACLGKHFFTTCLFLSSKIYRNEVLTVYSARRHQERSYEAATVDASTTWIIWDLFHECPCSSEYSWIHHGDNVFRGGCFER